VALPLGAVLWYGVNVALPTTPDAAQLAPLLTCLGASIAGALVTVTGERASRRCLGAAAASGALVSVVQVFVGPGGRALPYSDSLGSFFPLVVLVLFVASAIAGACRGAVFAAAALLVTRALDATRSRPSLDSADRVLFASSLSLGLWGTGAWLLRADPLVRALASGTLVLGLLGLLVVLARDVRRLRWLGAVARGDIPGSALVADDGGAPPSPPIPRFADYDDDELDGYLVKGSGRTERVAELPSDAARARAPMQRRCAIALAAAVAFALSLSLAARGLLDALRAGSS
jgi:hypothetical protein